jgi:hypothetical protein
MNEQDEKWGATEHLLAGAGVGAAGVTNSIAFIGLSTGLTLLPLGIVVGLVGKLVWWGVTKIVED